MSVEQWAAVDAYVDELFGESDPAFAAALRSSAEAGLPEIAVSAAQGRFLELLVRMMRAERVLEIGTLGGYSAMWLARGLAPGGRVVTLESDARHAEVARGNVARAGLAEVVDVRLGDAVDTLAGLAGEVAAPFDVTFIDADKESYPQYVEWAVRLSRPGAVIVVDNVVRDGEVLRADSADARARGIRRFHEVVAADDRVSAAVVQTVGGKGWDGFSLVYVRE